MNETRKRRAATSSLRFTPLLHLALGSLVATTLLGAGCTSSAEEVPDDREYAPSPPLADNHIDVHATARALESQVQHLSHMRDGTLILLRQVDPETGSPRHRHEAWAQFSDFALVHVFTIDDPAPSSLPKQTRFEWGGRSLTLDYTGDQITGGVYIDAWGEGAEVHYGEADERATIGTTAAPLTLEETEAYLERELTWFIEVRHHPVVDWFRDKVGDAKEMLDKVGARLDEVAASLEDARSHRIFFDEPVQSLPPTGADAYDITDIASEAEARIEAEKLATNHLPDEVTKRRDPLGDEMEATSWEPARTLCSRSYFSKSRGAFRTEYACAIDAADCEAAGGRAWPDVTGSCMASCKSFFGRGEAATLDSYDPQTNLVTCTINACVDSFTEDTPALQPATDFDCCVAGLKHDACGTAPKSDAGTSDGSARDAGSSDGGAGDAGPSDGGSVELKCGRFEILDEGTSPPDKDGSGRVRDSETGQIWTRNYFRAYTVPYSGTYAEAAAACGDVGMRVPTQSELLRMLDDGFCEEAFNYGKTSFAWTSTQYNADTWWCVLMDGTSTYCVNRPGAACVK